MILVLDNHDSFTWNLVHYLKVLGADVTVQRSDALTPDEALSIGTGGVLISPGPGGPEAAGISIPLVRACAEAKRPLLGICLGHQAIGAAFGGQIERGAPVHGKTSPITHDGTGLFAGLPSPFSATRYHSLTVAEAGLPGSLVINARHGGEVMGLRHAALPIHGVQFHPESIASEHGHALVANFVRIAQRAALDSKAGVP